MYYELSFIVIDYMEILLNLWFGVFGNQNILIGFNKKQWNKNKIKNKLYNIKIIKFK